MRPCRSGRRQSNPILKSYTWQTFMNLSWQMFIIEGNEVAAGGLISNILRIISIVLAIIITILHKRKSKKRIFDYPVWSFR